MAIGTAAAMHWTNRVAPPSVHRVTTVATRPRTRVRTSVALKAVMAVSGALLVLFLVAHMLGNLKIFFGAAAFDHYARWLRTIGGPVLPGGGYLWIQRAVLTVAV